MPKCPLCAENLGAAEHAVLLALAEMEQIFPERAGFTEIEIIDYINRNFAGYTIADFHRYFESEPDTSVN